ncbi:hypothetical protein O0I10_009191 [Lichtheimia ornata]|uniref:phospholipase D n=1 Tax=Lichtheimia ornata TaxID=688661 RepID=A0AAD7UYA1_9FUNG|nr:uncharacterized protein O0I10_009191 [Lichtheimia ornata]KAJ8655156.1 hypothetical protein O0I10_009191 [Lichtheimia ornata]
MSFFVNLVQDLFDGNDEEEQREEELSQTYHRHGSFAPVRHDAKVKFFIDGHDYFWAVSEALANARHVIFIEDWWLYLRRPPAKYPEYRIDELLKRKAEEGVKIFVVVYKEVSLALTINSEHTKNVLEGLHENIVVQRSPDFSLKGRNAFWSHHDKYIVVDNQIAFLGGLDLCYGRWDTHSHRLADFNDGTGMEIFPGQDYNDARVRDFEDVENWDRRLIDKTTTPRMPWHDISLCMLGGPVLDVSRHFCERWNYIKHEKNMDDERVLFLKPALGGFGHHQRFSIPGEDDDHPAHRAHRFMHGTRDIQGTCRTQVLRSVGEWSLGVDETEHSIQNAYVSSILSAEHFVYIENQFFITATEEDEDYVLKNQIGNAIVKRIIRAHEEREPFRVIVLMPLMPAFPADLSTDAAATARMVMSYQYMSICRGGKSIMERLQEADIDPADYIGFYSLRSHDVIRRKVVEEALARVDGYTNDVEDEVEYTRVAEEGDEQGGLKNNDFVSEELYIHAKLMIVDDRLVIMGSANLNDRSQCGDRDSEIALIVEDQDMIPSQMNGRYYEASRFAATLRRQLWKEHLGLLGEERALDDVKEDMMPLPVPQIDNTESEEDRLVMDPLGEETLGLWNDVARTNTEIFRAVFQCVPDDTVVNWDQYKQFYPDSSKIDIGHVGDPDMPVEIIQEQLGRVRGHLVQFPTEFLKDEDLQKGSIPFISDFTDELYT